MQWIESPEFELDKIRKLFFSTVRKLFDANVTPQNCTPIIENAPVNEDRIMFDWMSSCETEAV